MVSWSCDQPKVGAGRVYCNTIRRPVVPGVAATLGPDAVAAFDTDHAALLAERFPADPIAVPHRVWALVARKGA